MDEDDCLAVVQKYGTHYYTRADMGGKLTQVSSIQESYFSSQSTVETSNAVQTSFGASVSGYGQSASGSVSYAQTKTDNTDQQAEYESKTTKSSVIHKGRAPGSFGWLTNNLCVSTFVFCCRTSSGQQRRPFNVVRLGILN